MDMMIQLTEAKMLKVAEKLSAISSTHLLEA